MCRKRKESSAKERKRLRRGSKAGNCLARMTYKVEQSQETLETRLALALALVLVLALSASGSCRINDACLAVRRAKPSTACH